MNSLILYITVLEHILFEMFLNYLLLQFSINPFLQRLKFGCLCYLSKEAPSRLKFGFSGE